MHLFILGSASALRFSRGRSCAYSEPGRRHKLQANLYLIMASLVADEYERMTIDALAALRRKLNLSPEHNIVPANTEPPVWSVDRQMGICPRSGKLYERKKNDVSQENLLPCHFRLFPTEFLGMEAPFNADLNDTLCRFLRARQYDVDKAHEMFLKAQETRKELNADNILKTRDPNEPCWQNATPHYHFGHDKLRRPFYIELSGRVRVGKLMPPAGF